MGDAERVSRDDRLPAYGIEYAVAVSVLLKIGRQKAILRRAKWICASKGLENMLNGYSEKWVRELADVSDLRGDLEYAIAREVARKFNGHIRAHIPSRRLPSHRAYSNLRQLELFSQ
jgi:hypothetical protein